jgi:hypothetical protein
MTGWPVHGRDTTSGSVLEIGNPVKAYSSPEKSAVIQRSGRIVNRIPG